MGNRLLTNTVEQKTPFELFFGERPDVSKLYVFGSRVFVRIPEQLRKCKMGPKAEMGILIGYTKTGYRVLVRGKIKESPYVRLAEQPTQGAEKSVEKTSEPSRNLKPSEPSSAHEKRESNSNLSFEDTDLDSDREDAVRENEIQEAEIHEPQQGEAEEQANRDDQTEDENEQQPPNTLPRPPRDRRPPNRYSDYVVQVKLCTRVCVPETFKEAMESEDAEKWKIAMEEEMENLRKNSVWTLMDPPVQSKIIPLKWVFRVKPNGKYKARVVVVGFRQPFREEEETYSPVAAMTTLRMVLSVACARGYHIHQMDVEAAFLNGLVRGEVYVGQPRGYDSKNGKVYKLHRALYGLRESPRAWYDCFHQFIIELGFVCSDYDSCLYTKNVNNGLLGLILYVDDLLIFSQNLDQVVQLKKQLMHRFRMTDMGEISNYLGIAVKYNREARKMTLNQSDYIQSLAKKYRTDQMRTFRTPMEKNLNLPYDVTPDDFISDYRRLIGSLLFVGSGTRLDVAFAINYLSRFQKCATGTHFKYALRVLKYLQETRHLKLTYSGESTKPVEGWADADWAADTLDRKSTGGILIRTFGNPVVWICKRQKSVTRASTYAEYVALADTVSELFFIQGILNALQVSVTGPIPVFEDNSSAIALANKGKFEKRGKHIEVSYKFVADYVAKGFIVVQKVDSRNQLADLLTKALGHERFLELRHACSIR